MEQSPTRWIIYCHIHIDSRRRYIGLTKKTMMQRWHQHVNSAAKRERGWSHFANAIRKYGKEAFTHEVLQIYGTLEEANAAERYWIEHFGTQDPARGFNLTKGGGSQPHLLHRNPWDDPAYRAKMSQNIRCCFTPQAMAKVKATRATPESKARSSAATKAAMARPEVKAKHLELHEDPAYRSRISGSVQETLARPEVRAKIVAANRAALEDEQLQKRKKTAVAAASRRPEVRAKISTASRALWQDPEYRERVLSRELSDKTRQRLSAAALGRQHTPKSVERQRQLYLERSSWCRFCHGPVEGKRTCIRGHVACQICFARHKAGATMMLAPSEFA